MRLKKERLKPIWERKKICYLGILLFLAVFLHMAASSTSQPPSFETEPGINTNFIKGLKYRFIGPLAGGRVSGVSGIPGDPYTYYTGAVHGGVWKTSDGGTTWFPIFEDQQTSSIGAIEVSTKNPKIVYVGTGEACIRTDGSHGNGVYKSEDAGKTWKHVGLSETRYIGRVAIHPKNPDVVFVAALGQAWGLEGNEERGVFRTQDGGKTWEKVLYVNKLTGAADISIDINNPNIIFATMWEMYRAPWTLSSGGPGSGLFRSNDGGNSWEELTEGLPKGIMGKIGVAVSPADSKRVYADIEATEDERGMYRSDDGGDTWKHVCSDHQLVQRPWYYMHVTADPKNRDVVYVPSLYLLKSQDAGETFSIMPQLHPDNHSLWIDPTNPLRMINGNDGGANVSVNGGKSWTPSDVTQPLGPFYHINVDNSFPYRVLGTVQDYRTIAINSFGNSGQITLTDLEIVGGCQGGHVYAHPGDPNIVYSSCTDGWLFKYDSRTGLVQRIDPWPDSNLGLGADKAKYRFHWTSPLLTSQHDKNALYFAANVLFKSTDEGQSWTIVSPDLSKDDKSKQLPAGGSLTRESIGIEYYCLIFALSESPLSKKILWAGSDDGLVHVTRDGGKNWINVTPKDMPEWGRISFIDASPHEKGTAFIAMDNHQMNDYAPYIYKTEDFGKNWSLIVKGIPEDTFVRTIREDPIRKGLLFAGSENGVYVSVDDGNQWHFLKLNMPVCPIHDLIIKDNDLVVGTHGRGAWILTDISPLRQWNDDLVQKNFHLFTPSKTHRVRTDAPYFGMVPPAGENPPIGTIIYYSLTSPQKEMKISILTKSGDVIREYVAGKENGPEISPGLHQFVWDLRYPGPRSVEGVYIYGSLAGPTVLPGTYQVQITADGQTQSETFELVPDPRVDASFKDLKAQFELHMEIQKSLSALSDGTNRIREIREQLKTLKTKAASTPSTEPVLKAVETINKQITDIEEIITQRHAKTFADLFHYGLRLDGKLANLMDVVGDGAAGLFEGASARPTKQSYEVHELLLFQLKEQLDNLNKVIEVDIPKLNKMASEKNLPQIEAGAPIERAEK